jgi:hypothetical protein
MKFLGFKGSREIFWTLSSPGKHVTRFVAPYIVRPRTRKAKKRKQLLNELVPDASFNDSRFNQLLMTFSAFFGRPKKPAQLQIAPVAINPQLQIATDSSGNDPLKSGPIDTYLDLSAAICSENAFSHRSWFLPTQLAWINDTHPLRIWEKGRQSGATSPDAFDSVMKASPAGAVRSRKPSSRGLWSGSASTAARLCSCGAGRKSSSRIYEMGTRWNASLPGLRRGKGRCSAPDLDRPRAGALRSAPGYRGRRLPDIQFSPQCYCLALPLEVLELMHQTS